MKCPTFSGLLMWLLSLFRSAQRAELRVGLNMGCTVASGAKSRFLMVSCSWFSETAEFQEEEALDVCLLWASVQVLSQRKSPCQLSGSPRVAVFLFAEPLKGSSLGKLSHTHVGAQSGHLWVIKSMFGSDWGQEEKGTTEDEMAGWRHRLNRHEFG